MTEITNFTQPDVSPTFFIEFLQFLDNHEQIKRIRTEFNKPLQLAAGHKVLDLGCGIGGATFPIADSVGASGFAAGIDLSPAMIEFASRRAQGRP